MKMQGIQVFIFKIHLNEFVETYRYVTYSPISISIRMQSGDVHLATTLSATVRSR